VGTVKLKGLIEGEDARIGAYYYPYAQDAQRGVAFAIRTTGDPAAVTGAVRRALSALDPEVQLSDVLNMPDRVERSLTSRRTPMLLSVAFGLVALLLASIGIYGVTSHAVSQRTQEVGIRMAMGAQRSSVRALMLRQHVMPALAGIAIGLAGAFALSRFLSSLLYGIGAVDPLTYGAVTLALLRVAVAACWIPASRAMRVDPLVALRAD
jgi:putative ABC transport system permease protein